MCFCSAAAVPSTLECEHWSRVHHVKSAYSHKQTNTHPMCAKCQCTHSWQLRVCERSLQSVHSHRRVQWAGHIFSNPHDITSKYIGVNFIRWFFAAFQDAWLYYINVGGTRQNYIFSLLLKVKIPFKGHWPVHVSWNHRFAQRFVSCYTMVYGIFEFGFRRFW